MWTQLLNERSKNSKQITVFLFYNKLGYNEILNGTARCNRVITLHKDVEEPDNGFFVSFIHNLLMFLAWGILLTQYMCVSVYGSLQ